MAIYIILIFIIILSMVFKGVSNSREPKRGIIWLRSIYLYIFLLCALRSSSVGRDIPGYEVVYGWTQNTNWNDWDYVYYEVGYLFLMKICIMLGLSFQWFLTITYAIILYPVYLFIKKYSDNYGLSCLLFVCFQYLNFDLSGIRQALSMSIALIAYMLLVESKKYSIIKYIICISIATLFHKGAYICYIFVIAHLVKSLKAFYISSAIGTGLLLIIRGLLMVLIRDWFEKNSLDTEASLYIGTNFIMTISLTFVFVWHLYYLNKQKNIINKTWENCLEKDELDKSYFQAIEDKISVTTVNVKMYIISFAAMILFGIGTSARSYMLLNQVLLIQLPNTTESKIFKSNDVLTLIISLGLIIFFCVNVLIKGGFDIVPYRFFWENN